MELTPSLPFAQGRFEVLPDLPRVPHGYFDVPGRDIIVPRTELGDVRIHYREAGSGAPLLLVHGLMTTSYSFRYVLPELAKSRRVIALDLPGAGRSEMVRGSYAPDVLARFLAHFMKAVGIDQGDVVGNSMGGYLTMRLAIARPDLVRRLVCIHAPMFPSARFRALRAVTRMPGVCALLYALIARDPLRWAHKNVHYYDESLKSREEAREYGQPLASRDGSDAFFHYLAETLDPRAFASFARTLERTRPFPVPLLLLYSRENDPMVPPSVGEKLAAILPDAKMVWLDRASHFPHVDAAERTLAILREFLGP
ncbi:alpha/beta fold hydrolase [soil metagenome]